MKGTPQRGRGLLMDYPATKVALAHATYSVDASILKQGAK